MAYAASVIIPYLNTPTIARTLAGIRTQAGRTAHEVIVVGRDDIGRLPSGEHRFIETPEPVLPGAARNLGADTATGDVLCFIDADCVPEVGWLAAHLARHVRGESVVGGAVRYDRRPYWRLVDNLSSFHEADVALPAGPRPYLPSINLSVRAEAFRTVGPMHPGMPRGEDLDWTIRAGQAGYQPFFEPAALLWHRPSGRTTPSEVLGRAMTSGRWLVRVRQRYPSAFDSQSRRLALVYHPIALRLLAPAIAAAATFRIFRRGRPGLRYPEALPAVYATKVAWCFGAAAPVPADQVDPLQYTG